MHALARGAARAFGLVDYDCLLDGGSITYTVEISPLGLKTDAFFVIDQGRNELQIVITDPGTVITCVARKQFPEHHD
jgi:hypothetical protein